MSFHHPRIVSDDTASMSSTRFSRLGLFEKASALSRMGPPPARPSGSDKPSLEHYWRDLERLGAIDRDWQSTLVDTLRDVETGARSLVDDGLSDILTPEVIARFRTREYLAISAETQALANRSAAAVLGLAQGMSKEMVEMCSGQSGEADRILAHPERAVDRLVYEGFLDADRAFQVLQDLKQRETREAV